MTKRPSKPGASSGGYGCHGLRSLDPNCCSDVHSESRLLGKELLRPICSMPSQHLRHGGQWSYYMPGLVQFRLGMVGFSQAALYLRKVATWLRRPGRRLSRL